MKSKGGDIRFVTNADLGPEAYSIDITPKNITIVASRPAGFFYAVQTISQLLAQNKELLPVMKLTDEPRFGWRGFMLDEGRHFLERTR